MMICSVPQLNIPVAESSVRNFVRVLQQFPPQLRTEIGQYAGEHGLEQAARTYSGKAPFLNCHGQGKIGFSILNFFRTLN